MNIKRFTTVSLAIMSAFALSLLPAGAQEMDASKLPPASGKTGVTYAKDIKPIFDKSCIKCHGGEKPKGKLQLTSLETAVKGGKNTKDIVPGKSGESQLVFAIAHVGDDSDAFMPPPQEQSKIAPLTKDQIGLIRAWIDQGAK